MGRIVISSVAVCAVLVPASTCLAGLYHRDTIGAYDLDESGFAKVPDIDTFLTMLNLIKKTDNLESDEARAILKTIHERAQKNLTPEEKVGLATDMLRLRTDHAGHEKAMHLLRSILDAPDEWQFVLYAHLAHSRMLRLEYQDADAEYTTVKRSAFPNGFLGLSPRQLSWYRRLEDDYYRGFIRHRLEESRLPKGNANDMLDPIFTGAKHGKGGPVLFVGESGAYEVGSIAAVEEAKIPEDAIAIVQQMILWTPDDARLWWQLAELYNADGDLKSAARVFNLLKDELKYTNREVRAHAAAVRSALAPLLAKEAQEREVLRKAEQQQELEREKRMQAEEQEKQARQQAEEQEKQARQRAEEQEKRRAEAEYETKKTVVYVSLALVLAVVVYWQGRELARRSQARRAKVALQTKQVD